MCIAYYQMMVIFCSMASFEKVLLRRNEVDDGREKPVNQSESQ